MFVVNSISLNVFSATLVQGSSQFLNNNKEKYSRRHDQLIILQPCYIIPLLIYFSLYYSTPYFFLYNILLLISFSLYYSTPDLFLSILFYSLFISLYYSTPYLFLSLYYSTPDFFLSICSDFTIRRNKINDMICEQ